MAFWSTDKIKERQSTDVLIDPYDPNQIVSAAYELRMGKEFYETTSKVKNTLAEGEQLSIPPGQIALLVTEETVRVPEDAIALISIKATIKLSGLINISGFHVDPGFKGKLTFSVYNAGTKSCLITRGKSIFLIWFASLDQDESEPYKSGEMDVYGISDKDVHRLQGDISSPAELKSELTNLSSKIDGKVGDLSSRLDMWVTIGGIFLSAMLGAILTILSVLLTS